MGSVLYLLCLFCQMLLLPGLSSSHPLCTDSMAPNTLKAPLTFCPYNGKACCNSTQDYQLQKEFQSMNISDPACASVMKSILCATCDQFSAQLFKIESKPRSVPVLCNSTISVDSTQSNSAANDYCGVVWDTCQRVSMLDSPFAPALQGSAGTPVNISSSKLNDLWESKSDFCQAFGGASAKDSVCFDGEPVSLNNTGTISPPNGLCLEKIGNESYLDLAPHPDGSNRVFLADQKGRIWLATVPEAGSGGTLGLDVLSPFLDISDQVCFDTQLGLMGIAFHPNFVHNGRFFVSFNCDKAQWGGCFGRCSCNSDVKCDPSVLASYAGGSPCQYYSVISEFTVNGTALQISLATRGNPSEVRRIFTMGLPFVAHHGGQIIFGPSDGYLYFMMGDGGGEGDPFNFAQNKKSLLGKIMRFDVDNLPSEHHNIILGAKEMTDMNLWGNYSIPKDNPASKDPDLQPEIWASGLRNPWRCCFDAERPSYFICSDDGQDRYEEVDIITKGGNYGWRVYEGPYAFTPKKAPGGNTSANSINPIFPVMGYDHSALNNSGGSAAIIGGYYYRSLTDPCTYGKYIYADLYAGAIWAGTENPENSGNFSTSQIPFSCAHDSPIQCTSTEGSPLPSLGYIDSFGEDNKKDLYILATNGVYRFASPSHCNYSCSKENVTATSPSPSPTNSGSPLRKQYHDLALLVSSLMLLLGFTF